MDAADQKVLDDIMRVGWSDIGVFPTKEETGLPFNYTVGLTLLEHPELIIMGMENAQAHGVLRAACQRIKVGAQFKANTYSDQVLQGLRVAFLEVKDMYDEAFPMNMVGHLGMPNPTALQIIWPDREDRFPWHEDFDEEFRDRQFLLGPWLGDL